MIRPVSNKITQKFGASPYPLAIRNPDGSWFGFKHHGTDFGSPIGTSVKAPHGGTVEFAGLAGTAGNMVIIRKGDYRTRLLHLSKILVTQGRTVTAGQKVGLSGNTGFTFGAHLHWDLARRGVYVNPMDYVTTKVYYTVKSGDTLSSIARKYNTTVTRLKQLNPNINPDLIYPGQRIRVK